MNVEDSLAGDMAKWMMNAGWSWHGACPGRAARVVLWAALLGALVGCSKSRQSVAPLPGYESRPTVSTSLFPSDQAVMGDEAIERILSSKIELPTKARVALMRFPDAEGWRYRWSDEQAARLEQSYVETLSESLLKSDLIAEVTPLPSLMTPTIASIPVLREATVRMQADLLLVFRVRGDASQE